MLSDRQIAQGVRAWIAALASGTYEDREFLFDEISDAEAEGGFPHPLAIEALARLDARLLWRTFDDLDLQDLYDWAKEAGLDDAAAAFASAIRARVYLDDGVVPDDVKAFVWERDGGHCQWAGCGETTDLTYDHKVIPWVEGGSSKDRDNIQLLCRRHNSIKGTKRDLGPAEMAALDPRDDLSTRRSIQRKPPR